MSKPHNVIRFLTSAAALLATLLLALPAAAQAPVAPATSPVPPASAADEKIQLNFVNADIQAVIKAVSQHTGRQFILDPRVQGTVNIVSDRPVSKDMLYQILLSTLRVQGFAAVESDGYTKIVPESEAKTSSSPTGDAAMRVPGDRIVTQVFILQNETAVQLVPVLRPLVTANNFIAAYPNNNAIVITDYAENVRRIERIIRSIDLPSGSDVQIVRLQNASALDIAQTLRSVVPEMNAPANAPGAQAKAAIAVDQRTNSLIVRADNAGLMNRLKTLALGLDSPGAGNGNIYVVFLRNAEAARIADTLRGLLSGSESSRSTTTTTTPTGNTASSTTTSTTLGAQPSTAPTAQAPSPSSIIQAYPPTNSIIITAPEPLYRSLRTVIDNLDQRRAQVYVEALIVEVSTGVGQEFGVQWQGATRRGDGTVVIGGTNFNTGIAGGLGTNILNAVQNFPGSLGSGLNVGVIDGTFRIPGTNIEFLNLQVLARALEGDSSANVLSTPNVLTLDNEEAKIVVGQQVPFITGSYQTASAGSSTNPFQTIERKDIGLTLKVTPQVSEAGAVKLRIFQEVSSVTRDKALVQSADIITNKRSLESTVLVDNGQIVVLGGLIQDDSNTSTDKIPVLGDIPYLGALFKYETRNRKRTNLMVFLRPVVLKDERAAASLTADRYEYIRNLQGEIKLPWSGLLPEEAAKQLLPLEDAKTKPLGK